MIRKMRALLKFLVFLVVIAVIVAGGAWVWAGRQAGPAIEIRQPGKFLGRTSSVELMVQAPEGRFSAVDVSLEQNGKTFPVYRWNRRTRARPSPTARTRCT